MSKVLLVDDEAGIREILREYLEINGYEVTEAKDGLEAIHQFRKENYDVIILDVMMPKIDGWAVCKEIRADSKVPIIMLTARGEEYDRLFGFELGVDDYIQKPFSPKEVVARLKAIMRRAYSKNEEEEKAAIIKFENLEIEPLARSVRVDNQLLNLTPKEYELLLFLAQHPRQVFTRENLLDAVWGFEFIGDDRTVDTHIKMLREHLRECRKYIVTVWGTGYKFEEGLK